MVTFRFAVAGVGGDVIVGCLLFVAGTLVITGWPAVFRAIPHGPRVALGTALTFFGLWIGFGGG